MRTGRPTKYRRDFPERAEKLWAKGHTDAEVAKKLKIGVDAIYRFAKHYVEFSEAQKRGKAIADQCVERALFQRATGIVLPDCHVSTHEGQITITPLKKHYPPDPLSMIFWLKNRKPKEWREKTELTITEEIAGVPPEVVAAMKKRFLNTLSNGRN